ncbi:MAG: hypothetical protein JXO50_04875 [Deltaproteobacteria bacterium]|nr:hypothetical protein [Candidatus Anaeroferrophillus wilburensis]
MLIEILANDLPCLTCTAVIIIPEIGLAEAGHIRCLTAGQEVESKHEFHALSQIALLQFDDNDIVPRQCSAPLCIRSSDGDFHLANGVVICRSADGSLAVLSCTDLPLRKFFEAAHRFCTRWVRLDI